MTQTCVPEQPRDNRVVCADVLVDALLQEGGLNSTFATTLRQECIVRTVSLFAFGLFPPLLLALDVFAECFVLRCKAARFGTVVGGHLFPSQILQIGVTFSESPLELLEMIFRLRCAVLHLL